MAVFSLAQCRECAADFVPKPNRLGTGPRRFCSRECWLVSFGPDTRPATCEQCGGARPKTRRGRFCSVACRALAQRRLPAPRTCAQCGKLFARSGDGAYCSPGCSLAHKCRETTTARCKQCGDFFRVQANEGSRRFCSATCRRIGGRPTIAPDQTAKSCTRCERLLLLESFGPSKRGIGGLHSWCKSCVSAHTRGAAAQERSDLSDHYVAKTLGLTKHVAAPIIPAQRAHLRLRRELRGLRQ